MKVLIITAHPEPYSFNAYVAKNAEQTLRGQGHSIRYIDLYKEQFDPCEHARFYRQRSDESRFDIMREQHHHWDRQKTSPDVQRHIELLREADLLLLHFPFWWFGMPAILKGWMDRVFVYGGIYDSQHRYESGVMKGKKALMTVTAGASANACAYNGRDGDIRFMLWPPLHALHYIGYSVLEPYFIYGVRGTRNESEEADLRNMLKSKVTDFTSKLSAIEQWPEIAFNRSDDFNDKMLLKADAPEYSPFNRHHFDSWKLG